MNNKYYELITEIVKNHPKYKDYDSILEDIVNDVYSHAEVVLANVEDEDTLTSYLNKVAATSLITVPKRLNVQKRDESKANDLISRIKGNATNTSFEEFKTTNDIADKYVIDTIEPEDDFIENIAYAIDDETIINEEIPDTEPSRQQEEAVVAEKSNEIIDVDKNLVDLMINGVPEERITDEELVNGSFEELDSQISENEILDLNPIDEPETIETLESASLDNESDDDTKDENNIETAYTEEYNNEVIIDDTLSETDLDDTTESFESLTDEDLLDDIDNLEVIEEFNTYEIEENDNLDLQEDVISKNISPSIDYKIPDFSCLDFIPQKQEIETQEFENKIVNLEKKYPQLKIVEIFEARYKQNLPLNEIADKLNIEIELIIEALNELEDIVEA